MLLCSYGSYESTNNSHVRILKVYNLLAMYAAFSGMDMETVLQTYDGSSCSNFKADLADVLVEAIRPMQRRITELRNDPAYLEQVLALGRSTRRFSFSFI